MKKLTILILVFFVLLGSCSIITSLGEERDTSDYDDYREPYSETEPTFDYEGTSSTLAEIIDEYPDRKSVV